MIIRKRKARKDAEKALAAHLAARAESQAHLGQAIRYSKSTPPARTTWNGISE